MESLDGADDLDNLIADSISGVQSAVDGERKAASAAVGTGAAPGSQEWAKEAVRELQQGPSKAEGEAGGQPSEELFNSLVKTFQDEAFQKVMAEALQGKDMTGSAEVLAALETGGDNTAAEAGDAAGSTQAAAPSTVGPSAASGATAAAPSSGGSSESFLQNFFNSFDKAVGADSGFESSLESLMTSMLPNELICEPLEQISAALESWLKTQKGLPQAERARYEAQLRLYKQILGLYRSRPDPLPEDAQAEVQRLFEELSGLGQAPDEVMREIKPKMSEDGGENFEDFFKSMGLDNNIGPAEQDLLKKLSEDPEELTKVMKDMADGLSDEACKQQ